MLHLSFRVLALQSFRSAIALSALLACAPTSPESPAKRPDVVLIVVDTLRADRLGAYGSGRPTSPRIDRLAAEGTVFENPNAQASWTRPSMVSLFSGRYLTDYRDLPFDDAPALAEVFQRAGYRTLGAVANALMHGDFDFDRGFDDYDDRMSSEAHTAQRGRDGFRLVSDLLERVRRELQQERKPLFLYLHLMDPHHPYELHRGLERELPLAGARPLEPWHAETYAREIVAEAVDEEHAQQSWESMLEQRGRYDREVRFTDAAIDVFLGKLEALGVLEHAIVAVVSDHGEGLYDQVAPAELRPKIQATGKVAPRHVFHQAHGVLLDQSLLRTPFVLWGAGVPAARRVQAPVENLDLFPTLLQLCDVSPPRDLHGVSLVPWLRGESQDLPHEYVFAYVLHHSMVHEVETSWKLVLPNPPFDEHENYTPALFHLTSDPAERLNRYADEPEVVQRLSERLEAWREEHPMQSNADREPSLRELGALRALGYIDEDDDQLPAAARQRAR